MKLRSAMRALRKAEKKYDHVYLIRDRLFARAHKFNKILGWNNDGPDYWKAINLASSAVDRSGAHKARNYWERVVSGLSKSPDRMDAARKALRAFTKAGGKAFWSREIADMEHDVEVWSSTYDRTVSELVAPSASPEHEQGRASP